MRDGLLPLRQVHTPRPAFKCVGGIFAALCLATSAHAQDRADIAGSIVSLQSTTHPGAVAELLFVNIPTNHSRDNGAYTLTLDGLTVSVTFVWGETADSISVAVPDGFYAVPSQLDQPENATGVIYIYSGEFVGS